MSPPMSWNQFFSSWAIPADGVVSNEAHKNNYECLMDKITALKLDNSSAGIFTAVNLFSTDAAAEFRFEQAAVIRAVQVRCRNKIRKD
jgi:hypothetical protein